MKNYDNQAADYGISSGRLGLQGSQDYDEDRKISGYWELENHQIKHSSARTFRRSFRRDYYKMYKNPKVHSAIVCLSAILMALIVLPAKVSAAGPFVQILAAGGDRGIAVSEDGSIIAGTEDGTGSNKRIALYKNGAKIFTGENASPYVSKIVIDRDNDCLFSFTGYYSNTSCLFCYHYRDGNYDINYSAWNLDKGAIVSFAIDPQSEYLYTITMPGGTRKLHQYKFSDFSYVKEIPLYDNHLNPTDLAIDSKGNIYVIEQNGSSSTIQTSYFWKRTTDGVWHKYSTGIVKGIYTENIAVDHKGRVTVNFRNSGIVQFIPQDADWNTYNCDWILHDSYIEGMALDKTGNIYACISDGRSSKVFKSDYTPVPVSAVEIDKTEATMEIGESLQLNATVLPVVAEDTRVEWSSNNEAVATVSDTGTVTGVTAGTATITVKASGAVAGEGQTTVQASCTIQITSAAGPRIEVFRTGNKETYTVDETVALAARAEDGKAPYRYQFYVFGSDGLKVILRDYASNNTFSWNPVTPDTYKVGVSVEDAAGNVVNQEKPVTVLASTVEPLRIAVFRAGWSDTYEIGDTINLAARGEGGTAPYKYQFYVLRSNGSRVNFRRTPVSSNIYPWTPVTPDTYTLGVDVYDANGKKVNQEKRITVSGEAKPRLSVAVFRAGWSDTYRLGQTINLAARGEGGVEPYKYQFFALRSNGSRVNFRKDPVFSNIYPWTPVTPDTYTIGVDIYDSSGQKVTQQTTISVLP
ncbi:MAG: Ig-like domain-containing protein [Bacillota bacterium]|nr:Ig-like domain-containing protein [Bacillota bacterium]